MPAWCNGPVLSQQQIKSAIQEGDKYGTVDKFLEKGLRGKRVKLASAMAMDGISKYATFFNDWQAVAAEAAAASEQGRELNSDEIESRGLLHAYVELRARGTIPTGKLSRRYREQRAHLVLKIGDRVIQPVAQNIIKKSDGIFQGGKITLKFAFAVSPEDLNSPVEVILTDGDGNSHEQRADLRGVLGY